MQANRDTLALGRQFSYNCSHRLVFLFVPASVVCVCVWPRQGPSCALVILSTSY